MTETTSRTTDDGRSVEVRTGSLAVPVRREHPQEGTFELAWARISAPPGASGPVLVYLNEGPGVPVVAGIDDPSRLARWADLAAGGDLLLVDPRGCGHSTPDLRWRLPGPPPRDCLRDAGRAGAHLIGLSRQARAASTPDPDAFHTLRLAADLEAVRVGLGLDRIALLGFSYGAQLGLAYLRRYGRHVEAAVLAGVEGTPDTHKLPLASDVYLGRWALEVRADPDWRTLLPDPLGSLSRCMARLDERPATLAMTHRRTGEPFELELGGFAVALALCRSLPGPSILRRLPSILAAFERGDEAPLLGWLAGHVGVAMKIDGMAMLVDGAGGATVQRLARIRAEARASILGNAMNFPFPEVDAVWRPRDLGDAYRRQVVSPVRTLFVSGTRDWNAPPHQAVEAAWGFSDARQLSVEGATHEQLLEPPEVRADIVRFLAGEEPPARRAVATPGFDPPA